MARDYGCHQCHKCRYRNDANRLTRCLACKLDDTMLVANESAVHRPEWALEGVADVQAREARERTEQATELPAETEDALRKLIAEFASMDVRDVQILHGLLGRKRVAEIAREMGESRQTVHARLKNALRRSRLVCALYRGRRVTSAVAVADAFEEL